MIINFLRHSFSCCDKYTHREAIFMWAVFRLDIVNPIFLGDLLHHSTFSWQKYVLANRSMLKTEKISSSDRPLS